MFLVFIHRSVVEVDGGLVEAGVAGCGEYLLNAFAIAGKRGHADGTAPVERVSLVAGIRCHNIQQLLPEGVILIILPAQHKGGVHDIDGHDQ